jgi:hypothetical protein
MHAFAALLAALCAVPTGTSQGVQQQAYLGVFAETAVMKMAGMPAMPDMPDLPDNIKLPEGVKLPAGVKLPGAPGGMMMMGRPQRKLEVRLWSPGLAPADATAKLAIPGGLKLGDALDLELYRPKAEEGKVEIAPEGTPPDFMIKRYWGSSASVKEGQPEVIKWEGLSDEQKAAMREQARRADAGRSYFYKPDWTTGYWPAGKAPGAAAKDAALVGHYALTTTYTGNVEIDVPDKVDFLAPIELSSPNLEKTPSLDDAIVFRWKAVPNVLGYHARIIGMQGKSTIIMWSSSEIKTDPGYSWDYMQMAEVAERVKSTAMMAPDRVEVTVPASIFKDCDMVMFSMVGYGPGTALAAAQPLPRVQTKTTLQVMLGGKMMKMQMGAGE